MTSNGSIGVIQPDDRWRQIVAELAEGFVSFDADWRFTECNRIAQRLLGQSRDALLGRKLWDVAGLSAESAFGALARLVATHHQSEDAEIAYRRQGRARLLSVRAFPVDGGVAAVWRDITGLRAAERRLALSEVRFREIADDVPAAAWVSGEDGKLQYINQAMADALGRPRRALLGDRWLKFIDPEDRARMLESRAEAFAKHTSFQHEGRFRRPDGGLRIIQLWGRPRFGRRGEFRGFIGAAADITEQRESEQRHRLLINELNHRVKNTLATVQSVVRHTLRDYDAPPELERAVTERLMALSAAHNVLSRELWKDAELSQLVGEVLAPFAHAGRISTAGPQVRISPKTAIALSMGLMELATNAAKHGALSTPDGRVELSWIASRQAVALEWRERGGPPVASPQLSGFGSVLLGRVLASELGHPPELVYAPEGLICRIHAPVAAE
jgi:PAS domain S-box-containing protein